jgi:hypothetical protein
MGALRRIGIQIHRVRLAHSGSGMVKAGVRQLQRRLWLWLLQ